MNEFITIFYRNENKICHHKNYHKNLPVDSTVKYSFRIDYFLPIGLDR